MLKFLLGGSETQKLDYDVIKVDSYSGFAEFPEPGDNNKHLLSILIDVEVENENLSSNLKQNENQEKDQKIKDFWMPDKLCKVCYGCEEAFTMYRRRHHCRLCGQVFCHACSSYSIDGSIVNLSGQVRACQLCHDEVFDLANKEINNLPFPRRSSVSGNGGFELDGRVAVSLPSSLRPGGVQEAYNWKVFHTTCLQKRYYFTSLHFTSLHFTSLHFTSLHFTSLHFTSIYFLNVHIFCCLF
jgi:1-phosphatidylinositol-3-phosphate 5-kinase